jgi:23S rRNA (adenine2030-N6)-methyltransferase
MNYRHVFHAGNFGDCMKHALLVALLRALARKPAPFFVLDTHAGAGRYDIGSGLALRTREAAGGIMRLLSLPCRPSARPGDPYRQSAAIGPRVEPGDDTEGQGDDAEGQRDDTEGLTEYLGLVRRLGVYPGSPALIRALLRPDDRLACCELRPDDYANLRGLFRHDPQVSVHRRDGWEALKALLPPAQNRGLVLIDPPYEDADEFAHLAAGLALAHSRFPAGVLAAWYPVKHRAPVRAFFDSLSLPDVIAAELLAREPLDPARLNGCGMLIVNPPYQFERDAQPILDALLSRLGNREPGEAATITRLADE